MNDDTNADGSNVDGANIDVEIERSAVDNIEIERLNQGNSHGGNFNDTIFLGELGLDGTVRGIPGVLAVAHFAAGQGYRRLVVPACNAEEAACIEG
ncbi:MAG: hypothetical protein K5897_05080, partial [Eubacterium sp.]|nr:hypothetical protein [Eubacterium sp.]